MPQFYDPSLMVDLQHEQRDPPPPPPGKTKSRYEVAKGRVVVRDPKTITTIGLHQTAVDFSANARQIKASGGDSKLALARRALKVPCHTMAFTEGFFVVPNPLLWYTYTGNGMNRFAYQCEIDGKYPGDLSRPKQTTWDGEPMELTKATLDAARAAVGYMFEEGRKLGSPLEWYMAHRQFTAKTSDPGQQIWQEVGIDFCEKVLGLKPKLDYCEADKHGNQGQPIPSCWDPRSNHPY